MHQPSSSFDRVPRPTDLRWIDPWERPNSLPEEMEDFSLCEQLGQGSTGTVYKALQTKQFAVKVIPWRAEGFREIARHEFTLGQLFNSCDETLHSLGCYERDRQSYIVMEYGVPCLQYFTGRNNSLRDVLNVLLRISRALEAIHAKGYSHFDVKPNNILMVKGQAKLADFSHCASYQPGQMYGRPKGTGVYMAPEIIPGGKHTGKEDMYSLGITMYVLLTGGRMPFEAERRDDPRRNREEQIESLFIHPELLSIIQKAAAYNEKDRYQSFSEFSNALLAFMDAHAKSIDQEMPLYRTLATLQNSLPLFSDPVPTVPPIRCTEDACGEVRLKNDGPTDPEFSFPADPPSV